MVLKNYLHGKCCRKLRCLVSTIMGPWLTWSQLFFFSFIDASTLQLMVEGKGHRHRHRQ